MQLERKPPAGVRSQRAACGSRKIDRCRAYPNDYEIVETSPSCEIGRVLIRLVGAVE
jgi:hypothetical protein